MSIMQSAITDLKLAGYSHRTVETYAWHINKFIQYFDKEPADINEDEVKLYFIYLKDTKKLSPSAPRNRDFRYRSNNRSGHFRHKILPAKNPA